MVETKMNKEVLKKVDKSYKMVITSSQLITYLLDPKTKDAVFQLTSSEKEAALVYVKTIFHKNNLLTLIPQFCRKNLLFEK